MKLLSLFTFMLVINTNVYCQSCFGTYDSNVASLACVNYQMGFDASLKAAEYENGNQFRFTYQEGNDDEQHDMQSFYLMDKQGKFFNIHQYGFEVFNHDFDIVYKIINRYTLAEVAIVIAGQPIYYALSNISNVEGTSNIHKISGTANYGNQNVRFEIILADSDLVGFKYGTTTQVLLNIKRIL